MKLEEPIKDLHMSLKEAVNLECSEQPNQKTNINYKQSILVPVRKITFLGAKWFSDKEVRSKKATQ